MNKSQRAAAKCLLKAAGVDAILYERLGNVYVRSRHSEPYRLSEASRKSASTFGRATRMAKTFRGLFNNVLPNPKDRTMQLQLISACKRWLDYRQTLTNPAPDDITYLRDFQFNSATNLTGRLRVRLALELMPGIGFRLSIAAFVPTQAIQAPDNTTQVQCNIIAGTTTLTNPIAVAQTSAALTITYNDTPIVGQEILLPLALPTNSLTLIVIALKYTTDNGFNQMVNEEMRWLPCGVVGGWVEE